VRVLVTGATGFIGRALVQHLVADPGKSVTILIRDGPSNRLPPAIGAIRSRLELVYADLRNFSQTSRAVRRAQPDYVIHLAAAGVSDPFLNVTSALRHNLHATLNLIKACFERQSSIQQLVIGRTPGERTALNVYAASKAATWSFCRMYSRTQQWPIAGAMIFQAYGPGQPHHTLIPAAFTAALAGQDFPMTSGSQERDWIWVADVAAGLAAILPARLSPGQTVELGTGLLTSVAAVVQQIYGLVDRGGQPRPGLLPDRPGEDARQVADVDATHACLAWQAAVALPRGLALLAASLNSDQ
jgi:nucleoside-diphosphate-sugar epimerase